MSRTIPTYDNGTWNTTEFKDDTEFQEFIFDIFKEPGRYEFDETSLIFVEEATRFNKDGLYCSSPFRSKDFTTYWEDQKK